MMLRARMACFAALVVALVACGGGEGGEGGGSLSAPAAPVLVKVMPMAGVLHVEWTTSTTCDVIDAERKDDAHPEYAAAFEVTGDKTSHMDGDAGMDATYTYRVRCKVGSTYSGYSNELSANPTVMEP